MEGERLFGRLLAGVGSFGRNGGALREEMQAGRAAFRGPGAAGARKMGYKDPVVAKGRKAYGKLRNRGAIRVGAGGAVIGMGIAAHKNSSGYKQYQGQPSMQGLPTQSLYGYR